MRLLNAEEFKKEPYGTVYCMYKPQIFVNQLKIKSDPRGEEFGNSWYAIDLIPWAISSTSQESFKELLKGEKDSAYEIETEVFCTDDSTYDHHEHMKFATFNKKEVISMIKVLIESLSDYIGSEM